MGGLEAITTERLRGERLGPRHVDVLEPIFGDPRVGATMGGVWSRQFIAETATAIDGHWEEHGFGYLMWFERSSGERYRYSGAVSVNLIVFPDGSVTRNSRLPHGCRTIPCTTCAPLAASSAWSSSSPDANV